MKHILIILVVIFFTWPAVVAAYLCAAMSEGWFAGRHFYADHAEAAYKFFTSINKPKP